MKLKPTRSGNTDDSTSGIKKWRPKRKLEFEGMVKDWSPPKKSTSFEFSSETKMLHGVARCCKKSRSLHSFTFMPPYLHSMSKIFEVLPAIAYSK